MVIKAGISDLYGVAAAMLGISDITSENLNTVSSYYFTAVDICHIRKAFAKDNNTTLDMNTASICGFAGLTGLAIHVSLLISSIAEAYVPV